MTFPFVLSALALLSGKSPEVRNLGKKEVIPFFL